MLKVYYFIIFHREENSILFHLNNVKIQTLTKYVFIFGVTRKVSYQCYHEKSEKMTSLIPSESKTKNLHRRKSGGSLALVSGFIVYKAYFVLINTVLTLLSQRTSAPKDSPAKRRGIITLPSMETGGTSRVIALPLR